MEHYYRNRLSLLLAMYVAPGLYEEILALNALTIERHQMLHKESGVTQTPTGVLKQLMREMADEEDNGYPETKTKTTEGEIITPAGSDRG